MKFPPKSSILRPEIVDENKAIINNVPIILLNGLDEIHCDKYTKEEAEIFFDLRDKAFQKMKFEPTSQTSGDIETGEIRIVIETKDTAKNENSAKHDN
jgi:hypothetical protein